MPAAAKVTTLLQMLNSASTSTVNVKLVSGDLFSNAEIMAVATDGLQILDTEAKLLRYIPLSAVSYVSVPNA